MSVLIKGMEMPKACIECVFYRRTDPIYDYCCVSSAAPQNYIPTDCPLVPVPKHGRLIDGNSLSKVVLNWIATQEKAYPNEDSNELSWRLGARAMGNQIYRDIEAAPTIIKAEEDEA